MNIDQMLKETRLTGEQLIKFETDINKHKWRYVKLNNEFISDDEGIRKLLLELFIMRYKLNISVADMAKHYGLDQRAIQLKLLKLGWQRDRFEAQAIASTKRNYKQIKSKSIATMIQKTSFATGSEVENYIRQMINQSLTGKLDCEVIVGLNNRSILQGLEIDIPIIINNNNITLKYAIEINGKYWHKNEIYEKRKETAINATNYKYIVINVDGSLKNSKSKINIEIDKVVSQIVEEVNNTSFFIAKS